MNIENKNKLKNQEELKMNNVVKVDEREAQWIQLVGSVGLSKIEIVKRYAYKYMDVVNVLRGNSFSWITGILNRNITQEEYIVVKRLLKQGHPYRDVANYAGIDSNKVRNIMGVLQYKKEL